MRPAIFTGDIESGVKRRVSSSELSLRFSEKLIIGLSREATHLPSLAYYSPARSQACEVLVEWSRFSRSATFINQFLL